jgi:hypothetical protein
MIYFICIFFSMTIYLSNHGVLSWVRTTLGF